ncbi:nitrate- and nitrite sensing domain-containing protein [Cellulosimicrobium sp. NPDC057127]|uniref:sensor histidine kinase n=1 Tax=Cellulosimicrobium sp. NPDC057127 TaxID=3346026 RepID=UPI00362EBD39
MSVRGKILAALAVPVLVLFVAAAFISAQSITEARNAHQTSALVEALAAQDVAGTEIAAERSLSVVDALGGEGAEEQMMAQRETTDAALDERDRLLRSLDLSALDPRVRAAVDATLADREELDVVRRSIDRTGLGRNQRIDLYSGLIDSALEVPRTLADTTPDRGLAQYLDAYVQLDELLAQQALELPVAGAVLNAAQVGQSSTADNQSAAVLLTAGDAMVEEARDAVRALPGIDVDMPVEGVTYKQLRGNVAASRPETAIASNVEAWPIESTEFRNETIPVRDAVRAETAEQADALSGAATTRAVVTIAATLLAIVASLLVAGLIARAIVNPLRRLTGAAEDVRERLPQLVSQVAVPGQGPSIDLTPISVESTDEVGQLATAFNDVNTTTVRVAREQAALRGSIAEMFVNVARRDQVLLNRQLAFLDDLERSEEDPGTLSNLFRLDHLATRMRRNAESLLVLAGIDSGRRVRQPMPASDVIRTASSEIELYDRVRLNLVVDPLMLGHNALNAAHLLAELLENATMFSEPHTPVEVTTGRDEHAVHVTVRDHGLGMTPEEIEDANRKVATHAASDVVGAQRLGLFVVGRLADRLGARVRFAAGSDGTGTEVTVSFPAVLFVADSNVPLPVPTDPLESGTQAAAQQLTSTGVLPAVPAEQAPQQPPVASQPVPVAPMPVASATVPVAPEPPVAEAVDIAALTDGTTQTGMPRRRSRTVDPTASAPSASFASGPQTGAIVLPPLATPALPEEMPAADDAWTPPAEVAPAAGSLPSRSRTAATPVEPESAEIPVLDVSTRSAMFSSFRPVGERGATTNPVDLGPSPDVTATDIPLVPDHHAGGETVTSEPWSPEPSKPWSPEPSETWVPPADPAPQAVEETHEAPVAPHAEPEPVAWTPEPVDWAPAPVDDTTVARVPLAQRSPERVPDAAPERAVESTVEQQPVAEAPSETAEQEREDVPAELTFEALPRFEELMADLPTRRSLRENQTRKRGIFGRRPRTSATPQASTSTQSAPAGRAPSSDAASARPVDVAPVEPALEQPPLTLTPADEAPVAADPRPGPVRASAFAGPAPAATRAPESPAPVQAERTDTTYAPPPSVSTTSSFAPAAPPAAPAAAPAVPAAAAPAAPAVTTPAAEPVAPLAARRGGADGGYGAPVPLVRRQVPDLEPLEDDYISDSVEARSDWMASAVLYEEMSTLLRGAGDFQETSLSGPDSGTYQPLKVEPTASSGLARRSRGQDREGYVDRFTARIDRDPEQLRARLSAFQSGTARGRVEGDEEAGSTWRPETMDHVPDSAPQAR